MLHLNSISAQVLSVRYMYDRHAGKPAGRLIQRSVFCFAVLHVGDVAVVVRFLGVPSLTGEAVFRGGHLPSVVLTAAVHTVL